MVWLMRNPVNIIDTGNVYPSYFEFILHFGFSQDGFNSGFTPKKDDLDNWSILKRGKHLDSRDKLYLLILEKGYGKNKRRIVIVTCGPNPASCSQYDHQEEKEIFSGIDQLKRRKY